MDAPHPAAIHLLGISRWVQVMKAMSFKNEAKFLCVLASYFLITIIFLSPSGPLDTDTFLFTWMKLIFIPIAPHEEIIKPPVADL